MTIDIRRALARAVPGRARALFAVPALLALGAAVALQQPAAHAQDAKPATAAPAAPAAGAPSAAAATAGAKVFSAEQKRAIEDIVKEYLIANPDVFLEIQTALESKMEKIQADKLKAALTENAADIFRRPTAAIAGNPKGDITVVEFFDYNCGYCKKSFPDLAKLIEADPNIKVVFKELPILSKASEEAARVALAARMQGKYWEVHRAIFESRAPSNEANALKAAEKVSGLDMAKLKADLNSPEVLTELAKTKELAAKMGINGTPHFLVGDRSIPGAPENLVEQIKGHAAELRKNGCSVC